MAELKKAIGSAFVFVMWLFLAYPVATFICMAFVTIALAWVSGGLNG